MTDGIKDEQIDNAINKLKPSADMPEPEPVKCDHCGHWTQIVENIGIYQHSIDNHLQQVKGNEPFTCHLCQEKKSNDLDRSHFKEFSEHQVHQFDQTLPEIYRTADIGDFGDEVVQKVSEWLLSNKWCLFISGTWGTGKTHAAFAIMRQFYRLRMNSDKAFDAFTYQKKGSVLETTDWKQQFKPIFFNVAEMAGMLRKEAVDDDKKQDTARMMCKHPSLIVIDDMGKEKNSEFLDSLKYLIINERYQNGRKTIVTSNRNLQALLKAKSDGAIISRLSAGTVLELTGTDRRVK